MPSANDHRIARNAAYLYGRMLLSMAVSLYTVRVVMDTLGVDDYGLYNVVGGVVAIFAFLNNSMIAATSRFLNFEMGHGSARRLSQTFATAINIHLALAGMLILLGETVGLWWVNTQLVILPERMFAANVTYQLSLVAMSFTIIQIPYTATVMAHEQMQIYAGVSLLNVFLKLGVVLLLLWCRNFDLLITYAIMMALVPFTILNVYRWYCLRHYPESHYRPMWNGEMFRRMFSFIGWDSVNSFAFTTRAQGIVIILNRFGTTLLNAAGSVALQVSGVLTSFAGSILNAARPQIIQQYARAEIPGMLRLLYNSGRYCFLLLGLFAVPMFIEMDYVLHLWLEELPPCLPAFCRLILISVAGELLNAAAGIGLQATGHIRVSSIVSGALYLTELWVMSWLLDVTGNPPVVYIINAIVMFLVLFINTSILSNRLPQFSIAHFWIRAVFFPLLLVLVDLAITGYVSTLLPDGFLRLVIVCLVSTVILGVLTYTLAFDAQTRVELKDSLRRKLGRKA